VRNKHHSIHKQKHRQFTRTHARTNTYAVIADQCAGVDVAVAVQQQLCHCNVAVVSSHMERCQVVLQHSDSHMLLTHIDSHMLP